jgi:hypothetical protein
MGMAHEDLDQHARRHHERLQCGEDQSKSRELAQEVHPFRDWRRVEDLAEARLAFPPD